MLIRVQYCFRPTSKRQSRLRRSSLCRKNALLLAQRASRPSRVQQHLTAQICHFDGYTYVTTTLSQCSDSPIAQTEKFHALDCTNSIGLRCWLQACFGRQSQSAHVCQRERERCLPNWVLACLLGDALLDHHKPCANWNE